MNTNTNLRILGGVFAMLAATSIWGTPALAVEGLLYTCETTQLFPSGSSSLDRAIGPFQIQITEDYSQHDVGYYVEVKGYYQRPGRPGQLISVSGPLTLGFSVGDAGQMVMRSHAVLATPLAQLGLHLYMDQIPGFGIPFNVGVDNWNKSHWIGTAACL
jgi:hypothetical protein